MRESERESAERLLLSRDFADWRDVEAMAALGTRRAREALRECARRRRDEIGLRAARALGEQAELLDEAALVEHIRGAEVGGLDALFDEIERMATEPLKRALLELARGGPDVVRCHAAAELYFLAGKAKERFDWSHRPFFLRFEGPERADREVAWRELAEAAGIEVNEPRKPRPAP